MTYGNNYMSKHAAQAVMVCAVRLFAALTADAIMVMPTGKENGP
jgi:hypothetical protein